jgi:tetratricopeptide (TPR) repeat protein
LRITPLLVALAVPAALLAQPAPAPAPPSLGVEVRAAIGRGDHDRAISLAEAAAEADPKSSDAQLWLGRAYGEKARRASVLSAYGAARKARTAWEKAVALDPDNVAARSDLVEYHARAPGIVGGDMAEAKRQAGEILKRSPARGHLAWGTIFEAEKDDAKAETEFRLAAETAGADAGDRVRGWWRLARLYERQGKKPEAVAALRRAVEVDPGYDRARKDLERLTKG